jgi:hypothetical protein
MTQLRADNLIRQIQAQKRAYHVQIVPYLSPVNTIEQSTLQQHLSKSLKLLVAGEGLEPPTRGL